MQTTDTTLVERYGLFGLVCLVYAAAVLWLLLRRRVTFQSSLLFLFLLLGLGGVSVLLAAIPQLSQYLGFALPSNFFFAVSIGVLSFLHLMALVSISRLEQRSITLVQEVALIHEELDRTEIALKKLADPAGVEVPEPLPPPPRS